MSIMVIFRLKNAASSLFILFAGCFGFFIFSALDSLTQTSSIGVASPKVELVLGSSSGATADTSGDPNNFLLVHNGFILSYNRTRGAANWVTWHLSAADTGDVDRTNAFAPDTALPKDFWIRPTDYVGSGFDRGHLCPSKDRSDTEASNRETFLMSNMQPQVPKLNQKTWKYLEDYSRDLTKNDEEYIYAGCYGDAGRIKNKITIPTNCHKIIVVLPEGNGDLKRIIY